MVQFDGKTLDIRAQNQAVEHVLSGTQNPRHRYLLQSYLRHRYLESAGRWEEILDPRMTVEHPVYHFDLAGRPRFALEGREQVAALYQHWTDTAQCIFYVADETVAVGDHLIVGRGIGYQQTLGAELFPPQPDADPGAMYLSRSQITMVWSYDDDCRLIGEDIWEHDDTLRAHQALDPDDILTVEESAALLEPLIPALPEWNSTPAAR